MHDENRVPLLQFRIADGFVVEMLCYYLKGILNTFSQVVPLQFMSHLLYKQVENSCRAHEIFFVSLGVPNEGEDFSNIAC